MVAESAISGSGCGSALPCSAMPCSALLQFPGPRSDAGLTLVIVAPRPSPLAPWPRCAYARTTPISRRRFPLGSSQALLRLTAVDRKRAGPGPGPSLGIWRLGYSGEKRRNNATRERGNEGPGERGTPCWADGGSSGGTAASFKDGSRGGHGLWSMEAHRS
jgi:hypothetical protein